MNKEYHGMVTYEELIDGIISKIGGKEKLLELSEEQLQGIWRKKQELTRLEINNPLIFYKPYESKIIKGRYPQDIFHRSMAKIRLFVGGNRSGKSRAGFIEDCWNAIGNHPYAENKVPKHGWIISLSFKKQVEVTEPNLRKLLPPSMIKTWDTTKGIIVLTNGSTIGLKSCEQDLDVFGGVSLDWCHCDEEPPGIKGKKIYDEILMRLLEYRGRVWFTLTPVSGMSWTYEELIERAVYDKDIYYIEVDTRENPYIPSDEIETTAKKLSADEIEMRLKGKYIQFAGLVYKEFNKDLHVINPFNVPSDWKLYRAIDHGINRNHPCVCLWVAISDREEYYIIDEYYETDKIIRENCNAIKIITAGRKVEWTAIDPATESRDPRSGKTLRNEYLENGIPTVALRSDKNLGIEKVKQLLLPDTVSGRPRIYIFSTCYNIIREFCRYKWRDYRGNEEQLSKEVVKISDDGLDALRYLIMTNPRYDLEYEEEQSQVVEKWYGVN